MMLGRPWIDAGLDKDREMIGQLELAWHICKRLTVKDWQIRPGLLDWGWFGGLVKDWQSAEPNGGLTSDWKPWASGLAEVHWVGLELTFDWNCVLVWA